MAVGAGGGRAAKGSADAMSHPSLRSNHDLTVLIDAAHSHYVIRDKVRREERQMPAEGRECVARGMQAVGLRCVARGMPAEGGI